MLIKGEFWRNKVQLAVALSDRSIERTNIKDANSGYDIGTSKALDGSEHKYIVNSGTTNVISWGKEGQQRGDNRKQKWSSKRLVFSYRFSFNTYITWWS
jgi:hypothetical protein